ncbi:c-type cytochrome [Daejeonella sp.]|jgi:cytochrome c|uniref:c-type cytochrome n=1 Tax=Daejeonella sp. TaxID=2805397 RepID=UPI0037852005
MKKIIALVGICSIIFACGGEKTESTDDTSSTSTKATEEAATVAVGSAKGEQLISQSDCLTCHKVDAKIVGPSYNDVANKYPATDENIAMLVGKIIQGGSGNWGEIPMSPHPAISTEDATEMVKYILSLKTN